MSDLKQRVKRREFLLQSASFLLGGLCGFGGLSRAFACGTDRGPGAPRIALIIDDIGFSVARAEGFLGLGVPVTYAVLPHLAHSRDLAERIHGEGHEVMLHQPMEPFDARIDPGPGALYVGDGAEKIEETLAENIAGIPFATGVNNHMGSRFTSSQREIREALRVVKAQGLFFVDSLTSSRSKAYRTAKRLHLEAARRNIFLDNRPRCRDILCQLRKLEQRALQYGHAIGIGHPFPETARALKDFIGGLSRSKIQWVHISRLIQPA